MNSINQSSFQAAFVNTLDSPKSTKHICFYTKPGDGGDVNCFEVYEAIYSHPDAPDYADIPIILTRRIDSKGRTAANGGHLVLLEAIQNTCKDFYQD